MTYKEFLEAAVLILRKHEPDASIAVQVETWVQPKGLDKPKYTIYSSGQTKHFTEETPAKALQAYREWFELPEHKPEEAVKQIESVGETEVS